jgi:hypothetical protein
VQSKCAGCQKNFGRAPLGICSLREISGCCQTVFPPCQIKSGREQIKYARCQKNPLPARKILPAVTRILPAAEKYPPCALRMRSLPEIFRVLFKNFRLLTNKIGTRAERSRALPKISARCRKFLLAAGKFYALLGRCCPLPAHFWRLAVRIGSLAESFRLPSH